MPFTRWNRLPERCFTGEAVCLLWEVLQNLHVITTNEAGEVLFALRASARLADDLGAFGALSEDDEDDGTAERDARRDPRVHDALLAPAPRQGRPVPAWVRPPADRRVALGLAAG